MVSSQAEPVQEAVRAYVKLLLAKGPSLGRPYVDTLKGSKQANLKELRVQAQGRKYRIAFLFTRGAGVLASDGGCKRRIGRQAVLQETDSESGNLV